MDLQFITMSSPFVPHAEKVAMHGGFFSLMHHQNYGRRAADRLAISYPDYRPGIETDISTARSHNEKLRLLRLREGNLGLTIRIFGFSTGLEAFLNTPISLDEIGFNIADLNVSDPMPIPSETGYCSYIACKGASKLTPSLIRRATARQSWERDPSCLTPIQLERKRAQQLARPLYLPKINIRSHTNGQLFPLFIRQQAAEKLRFAPNSYGLSTNAQLCSIPVF